MTERQIIEGMLDLLSDESKWMKYTFARNAEGNRVRPESDEACCWCLGGALQRAGASGPSSALEEAGAAILHNCRARSIPSFNDHIDTTFEDVRELLLKVRDQFND